MQTKRQSFVEALVNTAVGYLTAFPINLAAAKLFGYTMPAGENLALITVFTLWSFVRQYVIRRMFTRIEWKRVAVQVYVAYLKFKLRKEDDLLCFCGNQGDTCGQNCLPASFVSAKWYYIDNAVRKKFGKDTVWR